MAAGACDTVCASRLTPSRTGLIMSLSSEDVAKIAHLARLGVNAEDLQSYAGELSKILDLVDQLQAADTAGITPMAHPLDAVQRLRPDAVTESDQREAAQACAPVTQDGLYLVPRVVE